jgi:uncharacterized phage protein gp47/JayE
MTDYGVVPEGFLLKSRDNVLQELREAAEDAFGPSINTQLDSVLGQIHAYFADQIAQAWEMGQAVYAAAYPDSASDAALDGVAAITGATRLPATPSTGTLYLNLADGTTIPVGSLVRVGTAGVQFETTEEVENSTGSPQAAVEVAAESVDSGPIVGNAFAIDSIVTPIAGWSAKAAIDNTGGDPVELVDNQTLLIVVDDGDEQTVTFDTADFVDIGAATAAEIIDVLNDQLDGATAEAGAGGIHLESDTSGPGSALQVTGGTANPALGFSYERVRGMNWSTAAKIDSSNAEPFTLVDLQELEITVDDDVRTVTFATGDFVDIANATMLEVVASINDQIGTYAKAYSIDAGAFRIESMTRGNNSGLNVSAGDAATALGLETGVTEIGISGDFVLGQELEIDADFRVRREELLRLAGAGTVEAIRANVRAVDDVLQAYVFENDTDAVDGNGLPAHSIEAVVSGGTDEAVAEEIFLSKPAGIATYRDPGASGRTEAVVDSQGFSHTINFSRPTDIDVYVEADIDIDATLFGGGVSDTGIEEIQDAIVTLGATFIIGQDIVINKILSAIMGVTGVTDVTALAVDDVDPPVNTTNMTIAAREFALFSAVRIVININ